MFIKRVLNLVSIALGLCLIQASQIEKAYAVACPVCKKDNGKELQFCGGCRQKGYCSKECQTRDWKAHKPHCKTAPKTESKPSTTQSVRLFQQGANVKALSITTAPLRYPQMMEDCKRLETSKIESVLLLGAGLHLGAIPQLHELQGVFPKAKITVVDNFEPLKDALSTSRYSCMLPLVNEMKRFKANFALTGSTRQIDEYLGLIPDALNLENIELILEDFLKLRTLFQAERHFDVVVATSSLMYPILEFTQDRTRSKEIARELITSILNLLSPEEGKFYCDYSAFEQLFQLADIQFGDDGFIELNGMRFSAISIQQWSSLTTLCGKATMVRFGDHSSSNVTSDSIVRVTRHQ